jgi:ketosteroid isomerase-like protein
MGNFALKPVLLSGLLSAGLLGGFTPALYAQTTESPQSNLETTLDELEAAANRKDLDAVMEFYSPTFRTGDDLAANAMQQGLRTLWRDYRTLNYDIEVENWRVEGDEWIAETVTRVSGTRYDGRKPVRLSSVVRSRQYIDRQTQRIQRQDILAERTLVFLGETPPEVDVHLPEQVRRGESFDFDVVVQEPLNGDLLLGAALEEPITAAYLSDADFELELLQAGGIFKRGQIDRRDGDQWFSAILVRGGGITLVTQRVRVD